LEGLLLVWKIFRGSGLDKSGYVPHIEKVKRILVQHNDDRTGMKKKSRIQPDPATLAGKPVIAGTQITVDLILDQLAAGETLEQVLEAHPSLSKDDVYAAVDFATHAAHHDTIYPLGGGVIWSH
jgi:uncharacterized protein (DUF433 family)